MNIGFDFGTANCSVAFIKNDKVVNVPLFNQETYLPSTLCAPSREAMLEHLYRHNNILPMSETGKAILSRAINHNKSEGFEVKHDDLSFGHQATDIYLDDPTLAYYVKSPKSFLGKLGLKEGQLAVFEDIVCAMMVNVKQLAEQESGQVVTNAVIGRPVNFHNRGGEKSNQQALEILTRAAKRAGFLDVVFQYEPVAAGLEFESTLKEEKHVLVVDIGGGTSDCSLIKMGPNWVGKLERSETLLAHTGIMVGGNDLDIHIAFKHFMSQFGKDTENEKGLPIPTMLFWQAIAINDVDAQRQFYAFENLSQLKDTIKEAKQPELLTRMLKVYNDSLGFSIVREAEKTKIELGRNDSYQASIDLLDEIINLSVNKQQMSDAIITPVKKIQNLIHNTVEQAQIKPDVVYITGGTARSPMIRQAVAEVLPNVEIVGGDYFGSVTAGLARWADICFAD